MSRPNGTARQCFRGDSAPIAAVEYLEAALAFASNHGFGMAITQLDLTNRPSGCIDLSENYRRDTHSASRRSARRQTAASPDLNSRRCGMFRFEHPIVSITIRSLDAFVLSSLASMN